jgi:hypothetical protein
MTSTTHDQPATPAISAEELASYGITRVPVDYFHLGEFRYTTLSEAIAQAKRQALTGGRT